MTKRSIRLRPERREVVDLQRLAAAILALVAEQRRRDEEEPTAAPESDAGQEAAA